MCKCIHNGVIKRSEMMPRRCEESLFASVFAMASLGGLK